MTFWIIFAGVVAAGVALYGLLRFCARRAGTLGNAVPAAHPPAPVREGVGSQHVRINIKNLSCSCEEWGNARKRFRQEDPRRLCAHLCASLPVLPAVLQPFAPLVEHMRAQGQGVPCTLPSFAFVLGETGYLVLLPPEMHPWALVHMGRLRYAVNVDTGCWREDEAPPFAQDIANLVRAETRRRRERNKRAATS